MPSYNDFDLDLQNDRIDRTMDLKPNSNLICVTDVITIKPQHTFDLKCSPKPLSDGICDRRTWEVIGERPGNC